MRKKIKTICLAVALSMMCASAFAAGTAASAPSSGSVFFPPLNYPECTNGSVLTWSKNAAGVRCVQITDLIRASCKPECKASINLLASPPGVVCTPPPPACLESETVEESYNAVEICGNFTMVDGVVRVMCVHEAPSEDIANTSQITTIYDFGTHALGSELRTFTNTREVCTRYEAPLDCTPEPTY